MRPPFPIKSSKDEADPKSDAENRHRGDSRVVSVRECNAWAKRGQGCFVVTKLVPRRVIWRGMRGVDEQFLDLIRPS